MKRRVISYCIILIMICATLKSEDLYRVYINSHAEAELLKAANTRAIYRLKGGYLVTGDQKLDTYLQANNFYYKKLAQNVDPQYLCIDINPLSDAAAEMNILFEDGGIRIGEAYRSLQVVASNQSALIPLRGTEISYHRPQLSTGNYKSLPPNLDSLIEHIDQDSITAAMLHMQSFYRRLSGTPSNYEARDWIASQFSGWGYDSVVVVPFDGYQLTEDYALIPCQCYNVVCVKKGSLYPDEQIIVGAHFDAVPNCPGVDDNASGTVGVMEMARALKDIETEKTLIFVTFDSEEAGENGAEDYAARAYSNGDNIICMINLDMIGNINNSNQANLYGFENVAYSALWQLISDSLVGIYGQVFDYSLGGDHLAFDEYGWPTTHVMERVMSAEYHSPSDSTTYINFEYMTRMIKGTLATLYTIDKQPPDIHITRVADVGDGTSLRISWEGEPRERIARYYLIYGTAPDGQGDTLIIENDGISEYTLNELVDGTRYRIAMYGERDDGETSATADVEFGTPNFLPPALSTFEAWPLRDAIKLKWSENSSDIPLDFDHYEIKKDNEYLPEIINDTIFIDYPGDYERHDYWVAMVDRDGNHSYIDTIPPTTMKAGALEKGRILAINRSDFTPVCIVDEAYSGQFMRDALAGLDYDYKSDTSHTKTDKSDIFTMLDYELVIIAAESGRSDDIFNAATFGGVGSDLKMYLNAGGKVIIFGRWGDLVFSGNNPIDTLWYGPGDPQNDLFDIAGLIRPKSILTLDYIIHSDWLGALSQSNNYPGLFWDSLQTASHTLPYVPEGIPSPALPIFRDGSSSEILYSYDSRNDSILTEDRPIAWRPVDNYNYIFFAVPLSFMEPVAAKATLAQAVTDLLNETLKYIHGDANGDTIINIIDASFIIEYIFFGGIHPIR